MPISSSFRKLIFRRALGDDGTEAPALVRPPPQPPRASIAEDEQAPAGRSGGAGCEKVEGSVATSDEGAISGRARPAAEPGAQWPRPSVGDARAEDGSDGSACSFGLDVPVTVTVGICIVSALSCCVYAEHRCCCCGGGCCCCVCAGEASGLMATWKEAIANLLGRMPPELPPPTAPAPAAQAHAPADVGGSSAYTPESAEDSQLESKCAALIEPPLLAPLLPPPFSGNWKSCEQDAAAPAAA